MTTITVRNVNHALTDGAHWLNISGQLAGSRNGSVLRMPGPVLTVYKRPTERVLFSAKRDANPFFHFMEALWMLAGRNDVAFLHQFNKRMADFSDDGVILHGAYGRRWRETFSFNDHFDQLKDLVHLLRTKPDTRRAVLQMWCAELDLPMVLEGKDVPCNTQCYFFIREERLCMTVMCRSNDMIWGAYGANAVHFSMLLEYMAAGIDMPVGEMFQFSNDFHFYLDRNGVPQDLPRACPEQYRYDENKVAPFPMVGEFDAWDDDLVSFLNDPLQGTSTYHNEFFRYVARPMFNLWWLRSEGASLKAQLSQADTIAATDWQVACKEWIQRREVAK